MLADPIADMLTRIRNAYRASKIEVTMPHSNLKEAAAKVLQKEKYLGEVKVVEKNKKKTLSCYLLYKDNVPTIEHIQRISKPGRRVYKGADELRPTLGGYGITIISTSKGVMTGLEAKKKKLGGEVVCEVW
ncbi:MAG: 30S ribosomal protein S8 [Candidatus Cloacimonetes bacterium]|nr:30S ribosomal protein S8 [Candidatus Cloacimonadota bacterium]